MLSRINSALSLSVAPPSRKRSNSIIPYCTFFYVTILYYIRLYYIIPYLYCTIYFILFYYIVLYSIILCYITLHYIISYYIIIDLYYTMLLYNIILYYIIISGSPSIDTMYGRDMPGSMGRMHEQAARLSGLPALCKPWQVRFSLVS